MDKSCADNLDCRQDSYRKYHLFDQIAIFIQAVGCTVQSFAEKEPGHNTRQHPQKIRVLLRLRHNVSPQHAKYNIIDNNGNYRLHEHPEGAEVGTDKLLFKIRLGQLPDQMTFHPQLRDIRK